MAKNIVFPIKTATSCLLKWNWSSIFLNEGTTSSCHRNWHVPFTVDEFDNFHNVPYKIAHRESMLRGEWPESPDNLGCGYCKSIEDSGGRSDRMYMTETQFDQTPDELENNPTATNITPAVLEVFVSGVCNMACTYCKRTQSSVIANDAKKYNMPEFDNVYFGKPEQILPPDLFNKYFDKLVSWLENNGTSLKRFHILGGEPFYQKETNELLDVWERYPNPNLILNVISNFSVKPAVFKKYVDKINNLVNNGKIQRFDLTASVDCWGDSQEYVRRGFNSEIFEENLLYALQDKSIRINFNATHSLMSLDDYPALLSKKVEWESITGNPIALYGMLVSSIHVHPTMLGGDFFKDTISQIRKNHPLTTWDDQQAYENINGLLMQIEQSDTDLKSMKHFLTVYNELDRRHGSNWRSIFPRIAKEIEKHIIV